MDITYTYKIISVDEAARCMEIIYSADGHQTMHIGARLPFEGEALEDVVKAFAPVTLWTELSMAVVAPEVGVSGTITPESAQIIVDDTTATLPTPSSGDIPQTTI